MMQQLKKIIMTLALLVTAAGAWADGETFYLVVHGNGTSATMMYGVPQSGNPYLDQNHEWKLSGDNWYGTQGLTTVTVDKSCKNSSKQVLNGLFNSFLSMTTLTGLDNIKTDLVFNMSAVFSNCRNLQTLDISSWNTSNVNAMDNMFYNCRNLKTIYVGDAWNTDNVRLSDMMFNGCTSLPGFISGNITASYAHTGEGGYLTYKKYVAVNPVENTTDEWSLSMPGGNVLLTVAYKDLTATAATFDGAAIPTGGVTAYLGYEQEFTGKLAAAVTNADHDGAAVTTTADEFIYTSSDATVIGFKPVGDSYAASGALRDMTFLKEGTATLTVQYKGTPDLSRSAATLAVTLKEKTYNVSLEDGGVATDDWRGKVGSTTTDFGNLPIEGVKAGEKVTLKYSGTRRRVKSVKAVTDAGPLAVPLTMEVLTPGTIVVEIGDYNHPTLPTGMKYSVNGGEKHTIYETTTIPAEGELSIGDKVQFYGNGTETQVYGNGHTSVSISGGTAQVKVYGNIMSLLDEANFAILKTLPNENMVFFGLFSGNHNLTDASGLLLPATTLAERCYDYMFGNCNNLTAAPALPAETLAKSCYEEMFKDCTKLSSAPALPAKTLANSCYDSMFSGCIGMYSAPVLPAPTLVETCYNNMFFDCIQLTSVTCLATNISASSCLSGWVRNINSSIDRTLYVDESMKNVSKGDWNVEYYWTIKPISEKP